MTALTISDALALAALVDMCQRNAVVYWRDVLEGSDDVIRQGHFRAIVDENGHTLRNDVDVRDAYILITTDYTESEMKVSDAISRYQGGDLREDTRERV